MKTFEHHANQNGAQESATDAGAVGNYYQALTKQATTTLSGLIHGNLATIEAGSQGDFPYQWFMAGQNAFNAQTFNYMSQRVQRGDFPDTIALKGAGSFPQSYAQIFNQIAYVPSASDQQALTNAQNAASLQAQSVVTAYQSNFGPVGQAQYDKAKAAGIDVSTPLDFIMLFVLGSQWSAASPPLTYQQMANAQDLQALLPKMPPSGTSVLTPVASYLGAMGPVNSLISQISYGNWLVNQIKINLFASNMTATGGAAMTAVDPVSGKSSFVPGYSIPKSGAQIQGDLSGSQSISMNLAVSQRSSSQYAISINGQTSFSFGGALCVSTSASGSYDVTSAQGSGTDISISIAYTGYSVVPLQPQAWTGTPPPAPSTAATSGWFYQTVLQEAYQNYLAGSSAPSGFNFTTAPALNLGPLPNGNFGALSTIVVSSYPSITINYNSGSYSEFSKVVKTQTKASVSLFGFITLGSASTSTYSSELIQGSSNSQFSMTFKPGPQNVPLNQQLAYPIAAVPLFPASAPAQSVVFSLMSAAGLL